MIRIGDLHSLGRDDWEIETETEIFRIENLWDEKEIERERVLAGCH